MTNLNIIRYIVIIFLITLPFTSNATTEGAKKFIQSVSKQAIELSIQNKESGLIKLFEKSVDTKWIAKFVMGRHWRDATSSQKTQYVELHKQFLINSYVPKFKKYTNQKITVKKSFDEGNKEYLVTTEIVPSDGPSIQVDYKVRENSEKNYTIFDVIAEGISLITTQRSEFSSILSRKGVSDLIKKLKARV